MYRNPTTKIVLTAAFLALGAVVLLLGPAGTFDAATVKAQRGGAAIYAQNCARCHGTDGRAQTRKGRELDAVDLTSDDWTPDSAHDARIITNGKKSMPAFGRKLSSSQISAVIQYIRRFKR
ncbi:MAG TPA: cytochrome c [Pyrinomonadaceae bacterium]